MLCAPLTCRYMKLETTSDVDVGVVIINNNYISNLILKIKDALVQLNATNLAVAKLESMAIIYGIQKYESIHLYS